MVFNQIYKTITKNGISESDWTWGVIVMKGYSTLLRSPEVEPYYQMLLVSYPEYPEFGRWDKGGLTPPLVLSLINRNYKTLYNYIEWSLMIIWILVKR